MTGFCINPKLPLQTLSVLMLKTYNKLQASGVNLLPLPSRILWRVRDLINHTAYVFLVIFSG
jgi:hypothetical protein